MAASAGGATFLLAATAVIAAALWPLVHVSGHGRLIEPPSRASMWRYGFDAPANYNDHELYCGGFSRQWQTNGGKCGVCGDPWDAPQVYLSSLKGTASKYFLAIENGRLCLLNISVLRLLVLR
jgi:hypothetical protein